MHGLVLSYYINSYDYGYVYDNGLALYVGVKSLFITLAISIFFTLLYEAPIVKIYRFILEGIAAKQELKDVIKNK